jgi:type I restriction enzyme M protein
LCTFWFFDRGKPDDLLDTVLMIDARNVYTVVSARSHVFTDEQLANLTAITWLYRGEHEKFVALLGRYQREVGDWLSTMRERFAADSGQVSALAVALADFAKVTADAAAVAGGARKTGRRTLLD